MTDRHKPHIALVMRLLLSIAVALAAVMPAHIAMAAQYLAFQVFIGGPDPSTPLGSAQQAWTARNGSTVGGPPLGSPPSKATLAAFVDGIKRKIGVTGGADRKLAVIFGPLAFDQTEADIARVVSDVFDIAIEKNIAVGFHIDDSKFWARRSDLWRRRGNVEWLDWGGTPNGGMALHWGEPPARLAPVMCFNSKDIVGAVQHLGRDVIGAALKRGIDRLNQRGRPDLYAGTIVGWETAIGRDYERPERPLGYCALSNLGFGKQNPPPNRDAALEGVVHDFIELWAKSLAEAGVPRDRMFSHVGHLDPAMLPQLRRARGLPADQSYSEVMGFAPLKVTFNNSYLIPGLSYYGEALGGIYQQLAAAGISRWASCEGVNMSPATSMETYLAKVFNHGGVLANIFGWGIGPDDPRNPFRSGAEGPNAIAVYRKFVSGGTLTEAPTGWR